MSLWFSSSNGVPDGYPTRHRRRGDAERPSLDLTPARTSERPSRGAKPLQSPHRSLLSHVQPEQLRGAIKSVFGCFRVCEVKVRAVPARVPF